MDTKKILRELEKYGEMVKKSKPPGSYMIVSAELKKELDEIFRKQE